MRNHLYALDPLRFFAACCVLAYHLGFFGWASRWGTTHDMLNGAARFEALAPFTWFGWIGVQIFFVISGFVIANSAYGRSPMHFLKGRLLRLYPAAWICATLTLVAWLAFDGAPIEAVAREYTHAISLYVFGPWIDGVYWSLAVEIVFYALVFWALVGGRWVQLSALPWVLLALSGAHAVMVSAPGVLDWAATVPVLGLLTQHPDVTLTRYGSYFAAGIWIWFMHRREMTAARYLGLAAAISLCLAQIARHVMREQSELTIHIDMPLWAPMAVWLAALALIIAAARAPAWFEAPSPRLQAALKRVGLMTYPLFLTHNVVGAGIIREATSLGVNHWVALLVAVVAVVGLAYLVCATAEVELRKQLRAALDAAEGFVRLRVSH